jgi:hypothetical protein
MNNSFGLAFAPSVVNSRHEIAEGHGLSHGLRFHFRDMLNFHNIIRLQPYKQVPCQRRIETIDWVLQAAFQIGNAAKAAAYLPPVKQMQRGGSLEDELCPDEIEGWTPQDASLRYSTQLENNRVKDLIC